MRRMYAKLMVVVISAICLFLAIDYNMNDEVQAAPVRGIQPALTSYKNKDLSAEGILAVEWELLYVNPANGIGTFHRNVSNISTSGIDAWNTTCASKSTCLSSTAYSEGPVGTWFLAGKDIAGYPGSKFFAITKSDYDDMIANGLTKASFINTNAPTRYYTATAATSKTVYAVDIDGSLIQIAPTTLLPTKGFRRFPLALATLTPSKPSFVMREGNYLGALTNFNFSNLTLDTAGTSINYIVKSGDPGGVFNSTSGSGTKQTSLQLVNGTTSLDALVADRSGSNVTAKTYPIVVAVDEWKLTTQQPTPATVSIKVKPPFPTDADITWTATSGMDLANIPVNTPVGTIVGKISMNKYTADAKTAVTYSTSNTSSSDPFMINANGNIVVQRALSSSDTFSKDIKVNLVDSELDNLSINVQTKNLIAPSYLEIGVGKLLVPSFVETTNTGGGKITFREGESNVDTDAIIGTLNSTDNTDNVTYNIAGAGSNNFKVVMDADNVNGKLVAINPIQAGTYNLTITASDTLYNKTLNVSIVVAAPYKQITDFKFTQTTGLQVGFPTINIGKSAGTLSAKGEGALSYALTSGGSDNGYFIITGTSVIIDKTVTDKTYNLEVEITDAGSGKKKTETFQVIVAAQFASVSDLSITPDGTWEYKNSITTAGKRLGRFATVGGTAGYTYTFETDSDLGAQNANFSIKGAELWVGVADLVAGTHKINVKVTDVNNQTFVKALIIKVEKTNQTFTIRNSNATGIPLSDTTMKLTLDSGLVSSASTTYELVDGKDSVASITGDTITFLTAGTFSVEATNNGDSNYNPYETPVKTFVVSKSSITLQAKDASMLVGESIPTNQLMLVSGNVANDNLALLGTPTYTYYDSSNAIVTPANLTSAGTYKIVPSLNENAEMKKYDITYSDKGKLTIGQDTPDENYYSITPAKNSADWYKGDPSTKSVSITPLGYNGYTMISGDGGATFSASNSLTINQEKIHQVNIVLKKSSGAITSIKQEEIKLDTSAPSATTIQYQSINQSTFKQMLRAMSFNQIFDEDQRLTFSATDSGGSSLEAFEYTLTTYDANGDPISVSNPTKVSASDPTIDIVSDNRYSIAVKAVDKAGNEGVTKTESILLDKGEIQIGMSAQAGSASYDGTAWTDKDIEITLSSTGALEVVGYMVKEGTGEYVTVTQNPYIINQDKNDVEYSFKAISKTGKESNPVSIQVKRDSVKPAFRVDTTVNGVKYTSGSATAEDILFTFVKNDGNLNYAPVTYYYATSAIAIGDNGWTPIPSNATSKTINYNTTDTFYFKAVSDAGVSSNRIDGPTLLRFKPGESNIIVSTTVNGNTATPYDGTWTKEDIVFTLQGGIDDLTKIKTYQYTTTTGSDELSGSEVWKDMKEKGSGSSVNNQLRIQSTSEENYYFRVQVLNTEDVYSTTSKYAIKVDKTIPIAPTITYAPYTRNMLEQLLNTLTFDNVFASSQIVSFASSDLGGSELKNYVYVLKELDESGNVLPNPITKTVTIQDPSFLLEDDNRYIIEVKAVDGAGNESGVTSKQVLLDASEPSVSVTARLGSLSGTAYDGTVWTAQDIYLDFQTDAALGAKKYQYKKGSDPYQDVVMPMIINTDQDEVYMFKAISHSDKESSEVTLAIKRDSIKPVFTLETLAGDLPYTSGSATGEDITFNFSKTNVNPSGVKYYYATSLLDIDDSGWIAVGSYNETMKITTSNSDTYYFKAVSDAGVSSDIVNGPTLLVVKSEATSITIKKTINGLDASPYDGNFTKEDVVIELSGGVSDATTIKTYQYTTTVDGSAPLPEATWLDTPDTSSSSTVSNQLRISKTTQLHYFFRVQVKDTLLTFAQTSGQAIKIDKDLPSGVTITFASLQRNAVENLLNAISFDQMFKEKQLVTFQATDSGGSELKEYAYTMSILDEHGTVTSPGSLQKISNQSPSFQINKNDRYLIEVYAVDKAGNRGSVESIKFLIDDSDPEMQITPTLQTVNGATYVSGTWTSEDIYIQLDSTIDLGAQEYQMKAGDGAYQRVANNPVVLNQDANGILYNFKAISHSDKESSEKSILIKRDSVTPAFHVEATVDGNPYVDNMPTNKDVLFTMSKNDGNLNISNVSYYYATSPLGVNDAGWVKIDSNGSTLLIDETSQDTYYFKAVSEAGLSSIVMKAASLNIVKEAGTNIEITRNINGDASSSYTGSWTNQSVVVSLANGMADLTMIKGYQYCELSIDETPDVSTIWYDMPEKSTSSSVYNQISISSSKQKDYFYRVIANGTGSAYAQTSKSPIRIDTQNPNTPTVAYQPGIEVGDSDEYRKSYDQNQTATFSGTDLGGSGIKAYRYVIETLNAQDEVLSNSGDIDVLVANPVLQLTMGKIYRVSIRSIDNTGNISDPIVHTLDMLGSGRLDKVEDVDSGVVVEGKDNTTFDKDTIVEVKLITEEVEVDDLGKLNEQLAKLSKLPKESEIKEVYEIKLLVNGVEVVSPGRVKIKIPLTKELLELENRRVVYIDDDGVVSLMTSYEDGKHIIFETTHFSKYAITGKKKEPSDLNYDSDGDGFPDVNIDLDGDGNADLNIDTDNDKSPDINIDTDGDSKADFNLDNKGNRKPYINIGTVIKPWKPNFCKELPDSEIKGYCTNNTLVPYLNLDTNDDGYPDVNIDLDGDGNPEINIDVDQDNIPDVNIDGAGNGKATINIDKDGDGTPEENIVDVTSWNPTYIVNLGDFSYGTMPISNPNDPSPPIKVPNLPSNDTNVGGAQDVVKPNYNTSVGGAYTGDSTSLILWSIFALASGLGCITVFKRRKM